MGEPVAIAILPLVEVLHRIEVLAMYAAAMREEEAHQRGANRGSAAILTSRAGLAKLNGSILDQQLILRLRTQLVALALWRCIFPGFLSEKEDIEGKSGNATIHNNYNLSLVYPF
jgi:hypothetical protein